LPADTYAKLIRHAQKLKKSVVLDCDGEAFRLAAPEGPRLVKPNEVELAEWAGRTLTTVEEMTEAANELSRKTGGWVLVSLGPRGGLLVNAREAACWLEAAPQVEVRNTVGAGDALLAAVIQAMNDGAEPREWLKRGVATGTEATQLPPGFLPAKKKATSTVRKSARRQSTTR
jgi:fructose-1-phosphate kinase PfkB-like protein